jgi:hypothetical protein
MPNWITKKAPRMLVAKRWLEAPAARYVDRLTQV